MRILVSGSRWARCARSGAIHRRALDLNSSRPPFRDYVANSLATFAAGSLAQHSAKEQSFGAFNGRRPGKNPGF